MNNDNQIDVIKFYQIYNDKYTSEGNEREDFEAIFTAILYRGKWYRTSFTEIGQDGLEGF